MWKKFRDMTNKEKAYYLKACEMKCAFLLLLAFLLIGLYGVVMYIVTKPDYEIVMPVSETPTEEVVK